MPRKVDERYVTLSARVEKIELARAIKFLRERGIKVTSKSMIISTVLHYFVMTNCPPVDPVDIVELLGSIQVDGIPTLELKKVTL